MKSKHTNEKTNSLILTDIPITLWLYAFFSSDKQEQLVLFMALSSLNKHFYEFFSLSIKRKQLQLLGMSKLFVVKGDVDRYYFVDHKNEIFAGVADPIDSSKQLRLLGLGEEADGTITLLEQTNPAKISTLKNIIQVVGNEDFTFFIDIAGNVYFVFQCNTYEGDTHTGHCGESIEFFNDSLAIDLNRNAYKDPILINLAKNIQNVTISYGGPTLTDGSYVFLLDTKGSVFVFGDDACGASGFPIDEDDRMSLEFQLIPKLTNIREIITPDYSRDKKYIDAKDQYRTYFIDLDGVVFACGYNESGQLGIGNYAEPCYPTKIEQLKNIQKIYAKHDRTFFIDRFGDVFYCGKSFFDDWMDLNQPIQIPELKNIQQIIADEEAFYFLNSEGKVFRHSLEEEPVKVIENVMKMSLATQNRKIIFYPATAKCSDVFDSKGWDNYNRTGVWVCEDEEVNKSWPIRIINASKENYVYDYIQEWDLEILAKLAQDTHHCYRKICLYVFLTRVKLEEVHYDMPLLKAEQLIEFLSWLASRPQQESEACQLAAVRLIKIAMPMIATLEDCLKLHELVTLSLDKKSNLSKFVGELQESKAWSEILAMIDERLDSFSDHKRMALS